MNRWKEWARAAFVVLCLLLVLLSFLPIWWTDRWWVRLWDFPRLQIAALLLAAGIGLYFVPRSRWRWPLIGAVVAALIWQISHFLAYFPPYPKQVASARNCPSNRQFSLLNANVLMTNDNYRALLRLIDQRQPDIVILLEPDRQWARAVEPLRNRYPFRLSEPLPNTYGIILMSRLPMKGRLLHRLQPGVPSADVDVTLRDGRAIRLHALHPEPPLPGDDSGERDAELVMAGKIVRHEGRAAVVIGDLNDVAWSRTSRLFRRVAGMADPRVGRGLYPTFNARYPLLRWPLDHLFLSPHFDLVAIDVLPEIGSDHLPIFFRLCLRDNPSERKVAPSASPATEAEANAAIRAGKSERREEERER